MPRTCTCNMPLQRSRRLLRCARAAQQALAPQRSDTDEQDSRAQRERRANRQVARARMERALTRRNNVIEVGIHVHTNRDLPMLGKPNLVNMRTMRGAQHPPMRGYYEHTHSEAMTEVG